MIREIVRWCKRFGLEPNGFFFPFIVALSASSAYFAASIASADHPVIYGLLIGMAVQVSMRAVVVPLSSTPTVSFMIGGFLSQLAVNAICVGLVIAWMSHSPRDSCSSLPGMSGITCQQFVTAVSEGVLAVLMVHQYLAPSEAQRG